MFAESRAGDEIFERVKDLDPSVGLHWIMAGKGSWMYVLSLRFHLFSPVLADSVGRMGSYDATCDAVWRRPANSSNTQLESEHLVSTLIKTSISPLPFTSGSAHPCRSSSKHRKISVSSQVDLTVAACISLVFHFYSA